MIKKQEKSAVWPYGPYRYKTEEEWAEMLRHRVPKRLHWARHFRPHLMEKSITKGNMNVSRKFHHNPSTAVFCIWIKTSRNTAVINFWALWGIRKSYCPMKHYRWTLVSSWISGDVVSQNSTQANKEVCASFTQSLHHDGGAATTCHPPIVSTVPFTMKTISSSFLDG